MTTRLPFTRPSLDEQTIADVVAVLRSGWLASGPKVQELEKALSAYCGGRPVRTFTSATAALEIALRICGVGPGDEVIVPAMTFVATANVVMRVGAKPVFVDVGLADRNILIGKVEAAVTPRTRALMPVHFAGLSCDQEAIYDCAKRHGLRVIEDAAHAIGTAHRGRRLGSFGDLAVFSFHPNKNMTTIEGGAISFTDPDEAAQAELHRWHGQRRNAEGELETYFAGGKCNLPDVSAAVGLGQLRRLDEFNAKRRELVADYFTRLRDTPALSLPERGDEGHSWHLFAPLLRLDTLQITRTEFMNALRERGIDAGIHYPAVPLFQCYRELGNRPGDFPNAELIGASTVTLPLFPAMERGDVERVCVAVDEILRNNLQ